MPDRDDKSMAPIPGIPADSLVGLGGSDGFVGQCERELTLSMPPPPPKPEEQVTRSYPPIPIPSLPEMPLRARMLRPWMGAAAGAVLIAIVGLASGDDEQTAPSAGAEGDAPAATRSFGADLSRVAGAALDAGKGQAARRDEAADRVNPGVEAAHEETVRGGAGGRVASTGKASPKPSQDAKSGAKRAFDRDAARSAIFSAAARATGCRTKNGPKGRGRATVTIGPSGGVTSVSVSPPFAGTKSGSCIASVFRTVHIAPFSGSAVSLGKSFTVR